MSKLPHRSISCVLSAIMKAYGVLSCLGMVGRMGEFLLQPIDNGGKSVVVLRAFVVCHVVPLFLPQAFLFFGFLFLLLLDKLRLRLFSFLQIDLQPLQQDCSVDVVEFAKVREFALSDKQCNIVELQSGVLGVYQTCCLCNLLVIHRVSPTDEVKVGCDSG